MRVPTQDNFSVLPDAVPQVQARDTPMPNVAGQQTQALGQAMQRFGGDMAAIQMEADKLRLDDNTNQAMKVMTNRETEYKQLLGKDALERPDKAYLPDEYSAKFKADLDKIGESLGNDRQRQAWGQISAQLTEKMRAGATAHFLKQKDVYQQDVWQANVSTATDRGVLLYADPNEAAQSSMVISNTVDDMAKKYGWDKEVRDSKYREAISPMHAGIIAQAVDAGNLAYAEERLSYATDRGELTLSDRLKLQKVMEVGQFDAKTQGAADSLWSAHEGDIGAALKAAREKYQGKEEDAIVTRLKTFDAERHAINEREQADAADNGWQLVAQGGRPTASLYAAMDGRDAIAIRKYLEQGPRQNTDVAKWLEFTNKSQKELAEMTPQTLMRDYRNSFTDGDIRNANEMILAAKGLSGKGKGSNEGLQLFTTADLTNRTARELGILPKKGKPDEEQEAEFFDFKQKMQGKINEWEAANGKKMPNEQLANLFEQEKVNKVKLDVWGKDPKKSVITVTQDQMEKAYVEVNGEDIPLSRIPRDYRANAMQRIKARGLAPTEQLIAQMWVVDGKPKQ